MIVKDESAVIDRCLASVRGLIDRWVICDTGSSDDTPLLIQAALAGIPGELHRRPWVNFGHNRTEALELARGQADWLLLLDADMELCQDTPLPALSADAYSLRTQGPLDYAVPRLIRGDLPWRYIGSTHEYLTCDRTITEEVLPALTILDHGDGGSRADKFERDAVLLLEDLLDNPDDTRATFYLAQTYKDLGRLAEARMLYRRRAEMGGWEEEVFYSAFQAAVLLAHVDFIAALPQLWAAWALRPSRAEPLYEIARRARETGAHRLAHVATVEGLAIPYPEDRLFVHRWVYEWGLPLEHAMAAGWLGDHERAIELNDAMLQDPELPDSYVWHVRKNRGWSAARLRDRGIEPPPVPPLANKTFVASRPPLLQKLLSSVSETATEFPTEPGWLLTNPSIAADGDGFLVIVRSVNYEMYDGGYKVRAGDVSTTVNYLARYDRDLQLQGTVRLDGPHQPPPRSGIVLGYEDCRLFRWQEGWWATATTRQLHPYALCEIALFEITYDGASPATVMPGPDPGRHEKNWMPFIHEGELHFLYSFNPFVIFRWDGDARVLRPLRTAATPVWTSGFRGGSQGIRVDDGYLFVIHEVQAILGLRVYDHRFVRLDEHLQPVAVSPPFMLEGEHVEFCAGAAIRGDDLVMSFGLEDRRATLATVPLGEVMDLLQPLGAEPPRLI